MEVRLVEGRLRRRQGRERPPTEARVFIADHHEGYIDWAMYEEHRRRLRRNNLAAGARREGTGAIRARAWGSWRGCCAADDVGASCTSATMASAGQRRAICVSGTFRPVGGTAWGSGAARSIGGSPRKCSACCPRWACGPASQAVEELAPEGQRAPGGARPPTRRSGVRGAARLRAVQRRGRAPPLGGRRAGAAMECGPRRGRPAPRVAAPHWRRRRRC